METNLASYNNSWYRPGPPFKRFCWYWVNALIFNTSLFPFYGFKVFLLKLFGAKAGHNVVIKPRVNIKYPWFLELGNNVWIGEQVWIDNLATVTIGNNVCLSQGSLLLTGNHNYTKVSFDLIINKILLEDGGLDRGGGYCLRGSHLPESCCSHCRLGGNRRIGAHGHLPGKSCGTY